MAGALTKTAAIKTKKPARAIVIKANDMENRFIKHIFSSIILSIFTLISISDYAVAGGTEDAARRICDRASKNINILADFTHTDCMVTKDASGFTLIFVSLDPIFAVDKAKKPFLIVLVGAIGAELNAKPNSHITSVGFMDKELGKKRTYFFIPTKDVARLQKAISSDQINLEDFYSGILAAGKIYPVKK